MLAFDDTKNFVFQKEQIRQKLLELLGEMPEKVALNPTVEYQKELENYTEYRISFDVEAAVRAVCILCIPKLKSFCLLQDGKNFCCLAPEDKTMIFLLTSFRPYTIMIPQIQLRGFFSWSCGGICVKGYLVQ